MLILNMKGQPCPIPVIETKKALRTMAAGHRLQVVVDNEIACQNLQKMARGLGHAMTYQPTGDGCFQVSIEVREMSGPQHKEHGFTVAIGRRTMGSGDEELGAMLMKSYIYALTELDSPPEHILLYHGGVHLACADAQTLHDLRTLEAKGTQISACGACLNFYGRTGDLAIGTVTNMFAIAAVMADAHRLINL